MEIDHWNDITLSDKEWYSVPEKVETESIRSMTKSSEHSVEETESIRSVPVNAVNWRLESRETRKYIFVNLKFEKLNLTHRRFSFFLRTFLLFFIRL